MITARLGAAFRLPLLLLAVFTLAACTTTSVGTSPSAQTKEPQEQVKATAPEPTSVAVVRPAAVRDPSVLRELDPGSVEQIIGPPGYVRHEGGAIIWQYIGPSCVVDLFWYQGDTGLVLIHYEARGQQVSRAAELRACLDGLWRRQVDLAES